MIELVKADRMNHINEMSQYVVDDDIVLRLGAPYVYRFKDKAVHDAVGYGMLNSWSGESSSDTIRRPIIMFIK